jgi:Calcium binding
MGSLEVNSHVGLRQIIFTVISPKCLAAAVVPPLKKGESVEGIRMAPDDVCAHDMLVLVRWQGRKLAVPLAQLTAVDPDESTAEALGDWHYWVTQGYCL